MASPRKSILLSNLFLAARSGSELHILTLAKRFKQAGWDVTCYTLIYAYPLQAEFQRHKLRVVTFGHERELAKRYDVFFAQHRIVSEYLWNLETVTFDKVFISILGIANEHETLPFFSDKAAAVLFISEESKAAASKEYDRKRIPNPVVFPNYATDVFFESTNRSLHNAPKRIAVFSNHVPKEIYQLRDHAAAHDILVDIYGYETRSIRVTPEIIRSYDIVISIGRTAQCCFASQVPFYCYDHFGGPGYITTENQRIHALKNFSGRSEPIARTAEELLNDILTGYPEAQRSAPDLRCLAERCYRFESFFSRLLKLISDSNHHNDKNAKRSEPEILDYYLLRCTSFVDSYSRSLGTAQFFYAECNKNDCSASEENSVCISYHYGSEIEFKLNSVLLNNNFTIIRFDPDNKPCYCKACTDTGGVISTNNASLVLHESECFLTMDPQYQLLNAKIITFLSEVQSVSEVIMNFNELIRRQSERTDNSGCFNRLHRWITRQ